MILAVLLDGDGRPVCTEMWPGNTADTGSLIPVVDRFPRRRHVLRSGKILIVGAVKVIDRDTNEAKPRRKGAKYPDTRSGRIRLAMIADNSAASIEAFVRANVKRGTTLLTDGHASYPGLTDYRHDPRVVGKMAGHVVLPWIHRVFALVKRWGLGTYHGVRRRHIDTYLNEFVFRYNRRFYRHASFETILGLATHHEPASYWDIIGRANPRKGTPALSMRHGAERRRPECATTAPAELKPTTKIMLRRQGRRWIWANLGQRDKPHRSIPNGAFCVWPKAYRPPSNGRKNHHSTE
jgi:hypothetical protein